MADILTVRRELAREHRAFIESVECAVPGSYIFDTKLHIDLRPETMGEIRRLADEYAGRAWAVIEADVLSQTGILEEVA